MRRRSTPPPSRLELAEVVPEFLDEYRLGSPKTLAYYRHHLGSMVNHLDARGLRLLLEITKDDLRGWLDAEQRRGIAASSIGKHHAAASTFFRWCEDRDYIEFSPMRKVRRPRLPQRVVTGFDREQCKRLVEFSGKAGGWLAYRDRAIVLFLLDTGARANELLSLRAADIDWPRHRVLLHGKGQKDRWVPLGQKAGRAVREYIRERPQARTENLWVTLRRAAMDYATLHAMLRALGTYASVDDVRPHRFRHTYASVWYERHKDILALRNLLGHSKVETTQRYLRSLGHEYGTEAGMYMSPGDWL